MLLWLVFLDHRLLEAERTFWRIVPACFPVLVHFPRCMPEAECSARCIFALTLWSCLHVFWSTVNRTWKNSERNRILLCAFPSDLMGRKQWQPQPERHCKIQFSICWDASIKHSINLCSLPTEAELFLTFYKIKCWDSLATWKNRVCLKFFFFFPLAYLFLHYSRA